ncbi:hypothetical protein B0J11DRAFT_580550 [Dendryphion nanum]|uniref:Uncharacterized protein n=1 Tax=Dendryphion nanum TaxID=256645 RepID=A0A9P9IIW0_9PLEO|nr:hypothetical protein B0J11DRAFT_580550 [Dendryphion nanum]
MTSPYGNPLPPPRNPLTFPNTLPINPAARRQNIENRVNACLSAFAPHTGNIAAIIVTQLLSPGHESDLDVLPNSDVFTTTPLFTLPPATRAMFFRQIPIAQKAHAHNLFLTKTYDILIIWTCPAVDPDFMGRDYQTKREFWVTLDEKAIIEKAWTSHYRCLPWDRSHYDANNPPPPIGPNAQNWSLNNNNPNAAVPQAPPRRIAAPAPPPSRKSGFYTVVDEIVYLGMLRLAATCRGRIQVVPVVQAKKREEPRVENTRVVQEVPMARTGEERRAPDERRNRTYANTVKRETQQWERYDFRTPDWR